LSPLFTKSNVLENCLPALIARGPGVPSRPTFESAPDPLEKIPENVVDTTDPGTATNFAKSTTAKAVGEGPPTRVGVGVGVEVGVCVGVCVVVGDGGGRGVGDTLGVGENAVVGEGGAGTVGDAGAAVTVGNEGIVGVPPTGLGDVATVTAAVGERTGTVGDGGTGVADARTDGDGGRAVAVAATRGAVVAVRMGVPVGATVAVWAPAVVGATVGDVAGRVGAAVGERTPAVVGVGNGVGDAVGTERVGGGPTLRVGMTSFALSAPFAARLASNFPERIGAERAALVSAEAWKPPPDAKRASRALFSARASSASFGRTAGKAAPLALMGIGLLGRPSTKAMANACPMLPAV
jgi:hypothetical protein